MGAFADLTPDAADYGAQQQYLGTLKTGYGVATIDQIFIDEARAQLLKDLQVALNRRPDNSEDMADIDEIVELHETRLKRILAIKQIELVYEDKNAGEGSKTYGLWKHYTAQYETERRGLPGLLRRQGSVRVRSVSNYR